MAHPEIRSKIYANLDDLNRALRETSYEFSGPIKIVGIETTPDVKVKVFYYYIHGG